MTYTVGSYLAARLAQIGLRHHFAVAGDFNLALLDQLLANGETEQVYCCNELNCGYAAEGYARANGAAAAVVTFSVGGLSMINAIAGANAENLPVIMISGAPNTNDRATDHLLHHTMATTDFSYQLEIAAKVTCCAVAITSPDKAPYLIDKAIRAALSASKPAYIEIACNIAGAPCAAPGPASSLLARERSDPETLEAAVAAAAEFIRGRKKPVILIGPKLRAAKAERAALALAEALGCPVAVMPAAKSFFSETHPQFVGIYWGEVSSPGTREIVDWADGLLCVGTLFNDYSTVGWTSNPAGPNVLTLDIDHVTLAGHDFSNVRLAEVLVGLAGRVEANPTALTEFRRFRPPPPSVPPAPPDAALARVEMMRQIQRLLTTDTTLIAETGDSWFNSMHLDLPEGARFEIEMQWGSIGWSVPATFGYAVGAPGRRVIAMIGDGSFQLTAQEVAQMIRRKLPIIIFLINNRGYTIEVEIHDGPYNNIKNWDYAGLINVFNAEDGEGLGLRAGTGGELAEAIARALGNANGPTLIECALDRDDCSPDLISWGRRVATANARPPQPR
ncbi:indolepyruvate decarboxylase [Ancylobacter aquaticus]|uniref:pyruvate decarboxylase n=1 Tax=Ancylobacter aquaticus TaxID=100 RepID=A0A4R1I5Q3_ANCAQ|nr:thiamine pyrophosphate-binding protein [Ancylobacter aquaticus]TCK30677.1 indolepyruvate decarboxylase [Ancylobacter aquaticus]